MPKPKFPPLGAHISVAKGFRAAFEEAVSLGASAMQIFVKSPMSGRLKEITDEEAADVAASPIRGEIKSVVVHASYLLNFAKPMSKDAYQLKSLAEDLRSIEKIGGDGVVLHLGKYLEMDPDVAEKTFVENLENILRETKGLKAAIILENTAGQGTEMGWKLEDYGRIFKKFKGNKRIKSCIDTAHLVGAGYDFTTVANAKNVLKELEAHVGLENIACIHFNDSKKPAGARVDRHEDIGYGTQKIEGFTVFATAIHKKAPNIPFILETPQGFATYKEQIALVKSWF